jgi:hypothetical protein
MQRNRLRFAVFHALQQSFRTTRFNRRARTNAARLEVSMFITLSVLMCLNGQCMTKSVVDSQCQPDLTLMSCLTQDQPSIARYISDNYPGTKIVKWQCQFGNRKLAEGPDL